MCDLHCYSSNNWCRRSEKAIGCVYRRTVGRHSSLLGFYRPNLDAMSYQIRYAFVKSVRMLIGWLFTCFSVAVFVVAVQNPPEAGWLSPPHHANVDCSHPTVHLSRHSFTFASFHFGRWFRRNDRVQHLPDDGTGCQLHAAVKLRSQLRLVSRRQRRLPTSCQRADHVPLSSSQWSVSWKTHVAGRFTVGCWHAGLVQDMFFAGFLYSIFRVPSTRSCDSSIYFTNITYWEPKFIAFISVHLRFNCERLCRL